MRELFLGLVVSVLAQPAVADATSLSIDKMKAVADAAVAQNAISQGDVIKSISDVRTISVRENTFTITAEDSTGQCYAQSADVYVDTQTSKIIVEFPRAPRGKCQ